MQSNDFMRKHDKSGHSASTYQGDFFGSLCVLFFQLTKSTKANSSGGLQADFNNAGPFAVSRKVHRAYVHLPSVTTAISRALL